MKLIDGKHYAADILKSVQQQIRSLDAKLPPPQLAVVMVGDDPASRLYIDKKRQACDEVGILSQVHEWPTDTSQAALADCLAKLSSDDSVHGVLVQLPLPPHLGGLEILQQLCPLKDVDGLTAWNQGRLDLNLGGLFPCTPLGCMHLARHYFADFAGITATVIGNSPLVGSPMSRLLLAAGASVTTLHSQSRNLRQHTLNSDLVVVATGHGHLVDRHWIKPQSVVIDVGISRANGRIIGDVNTADLAQMTGFITPVPGGVGPMTIAMLLKNCFQAYSHLCLNMPLIKPLASF